MQRVAYAMQTGDADRATTGGLFWPHLQSVDSLIGEHWILDVGQSSMGRSTEWQLSVVLESATCRSSPPEANALAYDSPRLCSRRQALVIRGQRLHQAHQHHPRQRLQAAMPSKLNGPSASGQPPSCWSRRASLPLLARARFPRPTEPVTMEYLGSRLNLGLDAKDIVRTVVCG
jgi:hypothetical protein